MIKQITTLSFLILLSTSATPALAVTGTPSPNPTKIYLQQERQKMLQENKENRIETKKENAQLRKAMLTVTGTPKAAIKDQIKENNKELRETNKENRKSYLSQLKINVITKIYNNARASLVKRYNYLVASGQKIVVKLDEKAAKGSDVAAAKAKLTGNTVIVKSYTDHLAALDAKFKEIIASEKPWTMVSDFRKAEKLVRNDLKDLRQLQIEALKLVVKK